MKDCNLDTQRQVINKRRGEIEEVSFVVSLWLVRESIQMADIKERASLNRRITF